LTDLPDVNVWVALTAPEHPHHQEALNYWRTASAPRIAFCSATMMGLLRVLTSPHVLGTDPLTTAEAWATYRDWRRDKAVVYAGEPVRCQLKLDDYVQNGFVRPKIWSDAYLAAFAESGDMRLVSFDADFTRFPSLNLLSPK